MSDQPSTAIKMRILNGNEIIVGDNIIIPNAIKMLATTKSMMTKGMKNSSDVFMHGKKLNVFNALNQYYIFILNVCATQELYKLIQQQNIIIQDLQNRINILENNKSNI